MRGLYVVGAAVAVLAMPVADRAAEARRHVPQPIYFWASTASSVAVPKGQPPATNRRVIRPSSIVMFADGSWALEKLHWRHWGSRVARATGISSASNGIPDQASGKRIKSRAKVTLSNPGRFRGHEVYRCFTLRIPAHPRSNEHLCLTNGGGYWYLGAVVAQPRTVDFYAGPPLTGVACEMGSAPAHVFCLSYSGDLSQTARLNARGRVRICAQHGPGTTCRLGNPGENTPTYAVGRKLRVGPFRCRLLEAGVRCTFIKTGKGFLISPTTVARVG